MQANILKYQSLNSAEFKQSANTLNLLEQPLDDLFQLFDPITLEKTNKSSLMLKRYDNKYVVDRPQFEEFLSLVHENYVILEIKGTRQFSYSSCYYDDNHQCYLDHLQEKRQRFKVRTREYVDSAQIYFEVKLKGLRGQTDKHRISTQNFSTENIENEELKMLREVYEKNYNNKYSYDLKPELIVDYRRCTLVAKQGGERVTIDFALAFTAFDEKQEKIQIGNNFIIIETKSADGKGIADQVLKRLGIRQASKCSKYCLGVNLAGSVTQNNSFLPMIKRISQNIISGKQLFKSPYRQQHGQAKIVSLSKSRKTL